MTVQLIAAGAVAFLFIFAWQGADWATPVPIRRHGPAGRRTAFFLCRRYPQLGFGPAGRQLGDAGKWRSFLILFAIFFPAVTGFTQGVSMSGDLADPGKSIPAGTFLAVGISIVVYFSVAVLFAAAMPNSRLSADYGAMKTVSAVGFFIDAGVIAATLSSPWPPSWGPANSAVPAADRIFAVLTPFATVSQPSGNPRRGVLLSAGIAFITIALGQLNLVASVVSHVFSHFLRAAQLCHLF